MKKLFSDEWYAKYAVCVFAVVGYYFIKATLIDKK